MKKNFFYKIESLQLMTEILVMNNTERGRFVTQLAVDLSGSDEKLAKTSLGKALIVEANTFRDKKRLAGRSGGLAKASSAIAKASIPLANSSSSNKKNKPTGFQPPTLDEVKAYCKERDNSVNTDKWYNFYESKGWMIGKNKMKSWKAAVRTWEEDKKESTGTDYGQY